MLNSECTTSIEGARSFRVLWVKVGTADVRAKLVAKPVRNFSTGQMTRTVVLNP